MEVRDHVLKSLEAARQEKFIGAPLEAAVHLKADGDLYPLLEAVRRRTAGAVHRLAGAIWRGTAKRCCRFTSAAPTGVKCERCWKYTTDVGSVAELPTVCAACAAARRGDRGKLNVATPGRLSAWRRSVFVLDRVTKLLVEANMATADVYTRHSGLLQHRSTRRTAAWSSG